MTHVTIENSGGILECEVLEWLEEQNCIPAIRDVPLRSSGAYVDVSTYVLQSRRFNIRLRLSDSEKTTLDAIYNADELLTITAASDFDGGYEWICTVWFTKKPFIYEYRKQEDATREWNVDLEFKGDFTLAEPCPSGEQITDGGFETGVLAPNWTVEDGSPDVIDYNQRSGFYCAVLAGTLDTVAISQTLGTEVPVSCIENFIVYAMCWNSLSEYFYVDVTYTDDTQSNILCGPVDLAGGEYKTFDVTAQLTAGKTIKKIQIRHSSVYDIYFDDITLTC